MSKWWLVALLLFVADPAAAQAPPVRGMVDLNIEIDARPLTAIPADVVVVPVFTGDDPLTTVLEGASPGLAAAVRAAAAQGLLGGSPYSSVAILAPDGLATPRLILLGAGSAQDLDAERLRRLAGSAVRQVRTNDVSSVALFVRPDGFDAAEAAAAAAEGAILGLFDAGLHKSDARPTAVSTFAIAGLTGDRAALEAAIARAETLAHAANLARSLVVEPSNFMTPEIMAAHARQIGEDGGLEVEIFDDQQMEAMGMGGVIAVGKGSARRPRFIVMRYRPAQPSDTTLALVGKGVTFDTGGISLKPPAGMYRMKGDMAGGAAVLGAMHAIARLQPSINVLGIVPAVDNAPSGTAQKPGDVFTNLSGRTVEVFSTDAEGRLILSDGISWAVQQGATHIVDIATLTGAIRTALGDRHTGAFASDEGLFERLVAAAGRTGESFWRMPLDDEYATQIRSSLVADLNETGGLAGASVGAKFLQTFTEGRPWVHLDIAGTSWPESPAPYRGAGPTGVTVRTLAELAVLMGSN